MYISYVAQVSNTAQVNRRVSLLGLIAGEQGRKLVNTFLCKTVHAHGHDLSHTLTTQQIYLLHGCG